MTRMLALASFALLLAGAVDAADAPALSNTFFKEAKITVNERAREAGYLRVRIQPRDGTASEAAIAIEKRMSENDIAKHIAEALGAAIGAGYEVDRDAGEHVKIRKADRAAADFSVEITFSAPGFSIILDT